MRCSSCSLGLQKIGGCARCLSLLLRGARSFKTRSLRQRFQILRRPLLRRWKGKALSTSHNRWRIKDTLVRKTAQQKRQHQLPSMFSLPPSHFSLLLSNCRLAPTDLVVIIRSARPG